jgi:uncharacterized protein (DUF302 family)
MSSLLLQQEKALTMNSGDPSDGSLVTVSSAHNVSDTIDRLRSLLSQKMIEVFADIDHAEGARKVGLSLRPTRVLIFGNAKAGTPLMQSQQTIGLDLPLRILVWEDQSGKVWLTYRPPEFLAQSHHILDRDHVVKALNAVIAGLAHDSTSL